MIRNIYTTHAGFGYFMVMARFKGQVVISPLFWQGSLTVLMRYPIKVFRDGYCLFDERVINNYHPHIQARFDFEKLKRWRWIDVTGGRFGKDKSSGYVYGDGGGSQQASLVHEGKRRSTSR